MFLKNPKIAEISDMDWAQHIMMYYAQNQRKDPVKAKQGPSKNFCRILTANFTNLQNRDFAAISSNSIKIAIFKEVLGSQGLRKDKYN